MVNKYVWVIGRPERRGLVVNYNDRTHMCTVKWTDGTVSDMPFHDLADLEQQVQVYLKVVESFNDAISEIKTKIPN